MNKLARNFIIVSALFCSSNLYAQSLKLGDPAPPIKVAKWLKGDPVTAFEPGKVYVVEFWATWCGACKANIPHLTDLAKRYRGRVTVVGVDIEEKPYDLEKVASFVSKKGNAMGYNVCADDAQGDMSKSWVRAAGLGNIPASFIVDQRGRFAWYCLGTTDTKALDQVLAGTFDIQGFALEKKHEDEDMRSSMAIGARVEKKDYAGALALADKTHLYTNAWTDMLNVYKLVALEHVDEDKALAFARDWRTSALSSRSANDLRLLGWALTYSPDIPKPSLHMAIGVYQRLVSNFKDFEPNFILDLLANAYALAGDRADAIKAEVQALHYTNGPASDPSDAAYFEGQIKKLKEGKLLEG